LRVPACDDARVRLQTHDHDRDAAGLRYVYPVVSRRARGVSVGVNLNPNNACNWRCIYCQVPELVRGAAPELDLELLERELEGLLRDVVQGDFMERLVPEDSRRLNDVALSGNGESTTSKQFDQAVEAVGRVLTRLELVGDIKLVLITNGSLISRPAVRRGLELMSGLGGEVWFKLDRGSREARLAVNDVDLPDERVLEALEGAAELCSTKVQTSWFGLDGRAPDRAEEAAYVALLDRARDAGARIEEVLLYGLARPSYQPEAPRLTRLEEDQLQAFAQRLRAAGWTVSAHP